MPMDELREKLLQQFDSLPDRLGGHIGLSLAALAIGILISLPLGIWAARRPRLEKTVLMLASIIQTIPSLALLAIMVFLWGKIGWLPAWIALILYSILPMLRNTITGLHGIDPAYIEAARGIGMSDQQMLLGVQLPLALPSIVSGIRTASVWVVGAATLAQPVGATSLGNYIFVGLQTSNYIAMAFGCVFSAVLALAFDWLLHGLEIAAKDRNPKLAIVIVALVTLLAVSPWGLSQLNGTNPISTQAIGQDDDQATSEPFILGSKAFTEQYILTRVFESRLEHFQVPHESRDGMGSAMVFDALASGAIDCFVDYTGTVWTNYMKRSSTTSPAEMLVDVATFLKEEKNIICLGSLGFSNDYAFAMRRVDAERLGISSLDDLAKHSADLSAATDIEFFDRPEWAAVNQRYGMRFRKKVTMDATLMYGAIANHEVDVIIAFGTDARLDAYDLKTLEDPRYALPPYDAILLVSQRMSRNPNAMKAFRPLLQSISTPRMRQANGFVDVEKKTPREAAEYLVSLLNIDP